MNHKLMPRLGSAIASTILSLFAGVSLVGVDKAQAAILTYQINYDDRSYFKVDTSLLTGIGYEGHEQIPVIEGRLYDFTLGVTGAKEYYDLATATAQFIEGDFRGLWASGSDYVAHESISAPDEPGGTFYWLDETSISWQIYFTSSYGYWANSRRHFNYESYINDGSLIEENYVPLYSPFWRDQEVSYTLVNTETVPEPLTAGGTALALAGLSWLKHKKKMAA
jgi:hypothetical protein